MTYDNFGILMITKLPVE